jgi:hypothetical protein
MSGTRRRGPVIVAMLFLMPASGIDFATAKSGAPCLGPIPSECEVHVLRYREGFDHFPKSIRAVPNGNELVIFEIANPQPKGASTLRLQKFSPDLTSVWVRDIANPGYYIYPDDLAFSNDGRIAYVTWTGVDAHGYVAFMSAISASNGDVLWTSNFGRDTFATSVVVGPTNDVIYFLGGEVRGFGNRNLLVAALDARLPQVLWTRTYDGRGSEWPGLLPASLDAASRMIVARDHSRLYIAAQSNGAKPETTDAVVLSYDARSGELLWSFRSSADGGALANSSPRADGAYALTESEAGTLIMMRPTGLVAFDSASGSVTWRHDWSAKVCPWFSPLHDPGICDLVVSNDGRSVYAFTPELLSAHAVSDGAVAWIVPGMDSTSGQPSPGRVSASADGNSLYIVRLKGQSFPVTKNSDLITSRIDAETGFVDWSAKLDVGGYEQPVGLVMGSEGPVVLAQLDIFEDGRVYHELIFARYSESPSSKVLAR